MKFEGPTQFSEEELKNLAERTKSDADLITGGAEYVNSEIGPRLSVTGEQVEKARMEMEASFAENPEVAVAGDSEVQEKFSEVSSVERKATQLDTAASFIEENNSELAERIGEMRDSLASESRSGEGNLEIARLKAEIKELNKVVQKSDAMSQFGHKHGFNKDETYAFVENRILENEKRIRALEQNDKLLEREAKKIERENEAARLKAEINELNKIVQNSEAVQRFGAEHGFNKDEVYRFIEERVLENEKRIREFEDGSAESKKAIETAGEEDGEKKEDFIEEKRVIPLPQEAEKTLMESYEDARGKKNWWGWVKERAKGVVTFGFWEFHQAERFRSNKNKTSKEIAEAGERIRKTENLSLEDALEEAQTMRMMAEGANVANLESTDYENYSKIISGHKIEENNRRIDAIVAESSATLQERMAKYKDEFGKVVSADERIMAGFEATLRNSLVELQNGQKESDAREFNKIIKDRLDPNYWRRYVYGALETVLGIWGSKIMITKIAASKWWLGKKGLDVALEGGQQAAENTILTGPEAIAETGDVSMHNTIWQTAKEWLQQNGVGDPSDKEVADLSRQIATDNNIGVKEWGISGNPLDTNMQQGHILKFGGASKILLAIRMARGIASII